MKPYPAHKDSDVAGGGAGRVGGCSARLHWQFDIGENTGQKSVSVLERRYLRRDWSSLEDCSSLHGSEEG